MSETRDEDLWTPEDVPPLLGGDGSIVEIDPYTVTLLDADFQRRQAMEAVDALAIAQDLRAAGLTVMEYEATGESPAVVISDESARQLRITAGVEHRCWRCGCSESRACDGGCVWATEILCSQCARKTSIEVRKGESKNGLNYSNRTHAGSRGGDT